MKYSKNLLDFSLSRLPKRGIVYCLILLLGLAIALTGSYLRTATATIQPAVPLAQTLPSSPETLTAQGQRYFESGDYVAAASAWQQAADGFAAQGQLRQQVRSLNNLTQAYQQLGRWAEASAALSQGQAILAAAPTVNQPLLRGQTWTVQGGLALARGQALEALAAFEQAEAAYQAAGSPDGQLRSQVNQARALRATGFYRQAIRLLENIASTGSQPPPTAAAIAGLRTLGELYRTIGDLEDAQATLRTALAMAQQLADDHETATVKLSLIATAVAAAPANDEVALRNAIARYQAIAASSSRPDTRIRAQIAQLPLLIRVDDLSQLDERITDLKTQLPALPAGYLRAYALIDAAAALLNLQNRSYRDTILSWLTEAKDNAQLATDRRAESYALGHLGQLYRDEQRSADAQKLTQAALELALQADAPDISYLWNAQLGDLYRSSGDPDQAIANYTAAVNTLETLRRDLVAIDDDARYDFQETVEPIYRNLVDLLTASDQPQQTDLQAARDVIEALQLAELENFFREACLPVSEDIDQVVNSARQPTAVLYPIILANRLEVVLKLPQQPLTHFSVPVSQAQLSTKLQQLRRDVVESYTLNRVQAEAQELYGWLIEPALPELKRNNISSLVFVLDGPLRNLPMALLYDGERYLIEKYDLAIAPGLQLVDPQPLANQSLSVVIAGISESRDSFPPLPYVADEIREVETAFSTQVLLNQTFTEAQLKRVIQSSPFPVVHLATHGQFSSNPDETFILAWDNRIPLPTLNSILRNSEQSRQSAIELLVLSACETATGDDRATLGLAGVAVRAGARSTLASLWSLDDETTARVMTEFYQALRNPSITRAEALRQAQRAILANPRYRHPRHWAPYVLIGNWL